jgi:hypothetical protein
MIYGEDGCGRVKEAGEEIGKLRRRCSCQR